MNRYFESSYLTWEILHHKNLEFILKTLEHLEYLEENETNTWKNSETSNYYFEQRPIGGERPFPVSNLNILTSEWESILQSHHLIRDDEREFIHDQGMYTYRQEIHHAISFSNASYAVFFTAENSTLKQIWFDYDDQLSIGNDRLEMNKLLNFLGEKYALILMDWYEKRIVDLSNKEQIIQFLNDTDADNL